MIKKSKYNLMKNSIVTDDNGNFYPDLATFPINDIIITKKPIEHSLTYNDCLRFFDLSQSYYGQFDFYEDIVLWLNDIEYISDEENNFEVILKLYTKQDIDAWYIKNL